MNDIATRIRSFTSKGTAVAGIGSGIAPARPGTLIDGRVYQHPRLTLEPLQGARVRITAPQASTTAGRNKRTSGLGMGAANTATQRGRTRDLA